MTAGRYRHPRVMQVKIIKHIDHGLAITEQGGLCGVICNVDGATIYRPCTSDMAVRKRIVTALIP